MQDNSSSQSTPRHEFSQPLLKTLRRGDLILFLFFLASAALIGAAPLARTSAPARRVRISCGGQEYGIYPLDTDQEIEIVRDGHTNIVSVENGTVHMDSADCRNQVCVDTGVISRTGETIVCLPNRVVVEILGDGKGGEDDDAIDAVVK